MPNTGVSALTSLGAMVKSFERSLFVQNKAALTVKSHRDALRLLAEVLAERGMPTGVETISREHVEEFLADQLRRWKPATAHARYKGLRVFFS